MLSRKLAYWFVYLRFTLLRHADAGGSMESRVGDTVLVNPIIVAAGPEKDVEEEGCLSFPMVSTH